MNRPKVKNKLFIFNIPDSMKRQVREVCFKRDIPQAKFVREAIKSHIEKYGWMLSGRRPK